MSGKYGNLTLVDTSTMLPEISDPWSVRAKQMRATGVLMDVETTGGSQKVSGHGQEIIEMAILHPLDASVLYYSKFKPKGRIVWTGHGITDEELEGEPTFDAEWPRILEVIAGRPVIAWNAMAAEKRFVRESLAEYGIGEPIVEWVCAMALYAQWKMLPTKRCKQEDAAKALNLKAGNHRAVEDTTVMGRILFRIAEPKAALEATRRAVDEPDPRRIDDQIDGATVTVVGFLSSFGWTNKLELEKVLRRDVFGLAVKNEQGREIVDEFIGAVWTDPLSGQELRTDKALAVQRARIEPRFTLKDPQGSSDVLEDSKNLDDVA